ncbi:MAG TPA: MBL fold metallo-hydrolase [Streptosporangiaceae bacterium]|jgi:L-ascorbate metabolism protein UlaG (beta-lactamase superfamily)
MRLTKLEHACVRLEKNGTSVIVDPGNWTGPEALDGAAAVLVTHEHFDHLNVDVIRAALAANHELTLWSNEPVTGQFAEFGDRVHTVRHGDAVDVAGFSVHVYGHDHELLHRDIPIIPNTGFLVDDLVFHPGDSYTVPEAPVDTLLLPVSGPWLKAGEMIDYARMVAPRRGLAIHDALLNDIGIGMLGNWFGLAGKPHGGTFERLDVGGTADL